MVFFLSLNVEDDVSFLALGAAFGYHSDQDGIDPSQIAVYFDHGHIGDELSDHDLLSILTMVMTRLVAFLFPSLSRIQASVSSKLR